MTTLSQSRRRGLLLGVGIAASKVALGVWLVRGSPGFTHVSDDDYARVVIAQTFAHAPRLDPSGTSWLPFPFWMVGGLMALFGRSLEGAQLIALLSGVVAAVLVYAALAKAGVPAWCAAVGTVVGMTTPWNAWLGVATVPEALTGALIACGAILLPVRSARPWAAAGLLVASLSRYEAWPVCAVFALACAWSALRRLRAADPTWHRDTACVVLAAVGPAAWMAWNAHAHDGPLHFLRRVASYRAAVAPAGFADALLAFPRALVTGAPEIAFVAILGASVLAGSSARAREARARWLLPLTAVLALLAFLVYGDLRDGAPTHHPERALVGAWWVLAAFGADGLRGLARGWAWGRPKREAWVAAATVALLLPWGLTVGGRAADVPGNAPGDRRGDQLAVGRRLAKDGVQSVDIMPCAYEHFATLAAFGAPERARLLPPTHRLVTSACPAVLER